MTYSAPPSQATGSIVGATEWNRLVDDITWLATDAPRCKATMSTTWLIANTTLIAMSYDSNEYDNAGIHSLAGDLTKFVAPINGLYRFGYCSAPARGASAVYGVLTTARLNATQDKTGQSIVAAFDMDNRVSAYTTARMAAGDFFQVLCYHNAGVAKDFAGGVAFAEMHWIGTY